MVHRVYDRSWTSQRSLARTGLHVGVRENPVAQPDHPLCHLVRLDEETTDDIEAEIANGEFDGYRANETVWRPSDEQD